MFSRRVVKHSEQPSVHYLSFFTLLPLFWALFPGIIIENSEGRSLIKPPPDAFSFRLRAKTVSHLEDGWVRVVHRNQPASSRLPKMSSRRSCKGCAILKLAQQGCYLACGHDEEVPTISKVIGHF